MNAGDLHERVAFDVPDGTADGYGGTTEAWSETYVCNAHFRYLRGGEPVLAARLSGTQVVVATIRQGVAAQGITTGYRMRDVRRGTVFNITAPSVPSNDRAWLEITATSGVAV